jgi:subtilisin-like proprotein convertase family protein
VLGYTAIVGAIALLGSALVKTPSVAKATAAPQKVEQAFQPEATSATFPANAGTLGAIPDTNQTSPTCQNAATNQRDVTFTVTGLSGNVTAASVNFNASHTFIQDLEVSLIGPGGSPTHLLFSATGTTSTTVGACSNGNDLSSANTYNFADTAAANWWTTAATNPIPASNNRTVVTGIGGTTNPPATTSINTTFASTAANGTWTLRFRDRGVGDTGTVTAANLTITAVPGGCTTAKRPLDYDGNGTTDQQVVRNTGGGPTGQITWYTNPGAPVNWGIATDFFQPADYDGDGKQDIAVWRPGAPFNAAFYILQSGTNTLRTDVFGQTGDDPSVVGDYDGDGKADPAVYRAGTNPGDQSFWYYRGSVGPNSGLVVGFVWGLNGDFPSPGDYDGDNKYDYVVQRNAGGGNAVFHERLSGGTSVSFLYGTPTDVIVPGYYDADCKADIAVVRSAGGVYNWFIRSSVVDGATSGFVFGNSGTDFLTQGDYDGDGFTDISVWRPNADPGQNFFYWRRSLDGVITGGEWGQNGDYPVANFNSH